jgi:hypothetical protein
VAVRKASGFAERHFIQNNKEEIKGKKVRAF